MLVLSKKRVQILVSVLVVAVMMFCAVPVHAEKLRMLVWEGYAPQKWIEKYKGIVKEKYNVDLDVEIKFVSSTDQFIDALKGRSADIITPSHNLPKDPRYKYITGKLILPIDLKNIPNYKDIITTLQKADYCTEDGQVYAIPFVYGPYGLAYNTDKLDEPQSWNILWDPKYAGQYTISSDYSEANIFTTALAMGIDQRKISNYDELNSKEFLEKLTNLYGNAKSYWEGVDTADVLQGLPLSTSWGFSLPELKKRGENWKIASPKEGTTGWIDNFALAHTLRDDPKMKRIAEEWLNLAISPEFQVEVVVRGLGSSPVNLTIKDKLTPEEAADYHVDDPEYFQKNLIPWPVLDSRSRKGFDLLMKRVKK